MSTFKDIRIMFLRNAKSQPVGCAVAHIDRRLERAEYQISVLNPLDTFNRKVARQLALGRLMEKPQTVRIHKDATMHDVSLAVMRDIAISSTAPTRAVKSARLWLKNHPVAPPPTEKASLRKEAPKPANDVKTMVPTVMTSHKTYSPTKVKITHDDRGNVITLASLR